MDHIIQPLELDGTVSMSEIESVVPQGRTERGIKVAAKFFRHSPLDVANAIEVRRCCILQLGLAVI